jgi:hypothetical protein
MSGTRPLWRALGSMFSRDEYRDKAFDCLVQSEAMHDPSERSVLVKIAQLYLKLADRIVGRYGRETHPENDS